MRDNSQRYYRNITKQTISSFKEDLAIVNWNDVYSIDDPITMDLMYLRLISLICTKILFSAEES